MIKLRRFRWHNKFEDFDIDNILIDVNSYKNILVYDISYKTFIGAKPLRVRFYKIDKSNRVYDETRYLVLFWGEKYNFIYNRVRHLIGDINIRNLISNTKIKVDSYHSLPLEKTFTFYNNIIPIKLVSNKDKNNYYYNMHLEKDSYQWSQDNDFLHKL